MSSPSVEYLEDMTPPSTPVSSKERGVEVIEPGSFDPINHFYPRVLNAQIHPLVRSFLSLGNDRIAKRYCHLHPEADRAAVTDVLHRSTRFLQWGGSDLFATTSETTQKRLVVVETNSCPSGQKSMPLANEDVEHAGYRTLLEKSFMPTLRARSAILPDGHLAVLYDKNRMEAWGYAATLADLSSECILLVSCHADDPYPKVRFTEDGVMEVRMSAEVHSFVENWQPVRAALRYVTQRPWCRIPALTRTFIYNPILACLAGGRNKMLAAKAYDLFNAEMAATGLRIYTPETIWDVTKPEVPLWVQRMGGLAVVKVPYANAGQGVWTITHPGELQEFMEVEHRYDRFIVQALIGNNGWSSRSRYGHLYHVGTIPNLKGNIYAADLRLMVGSSPEGFFPVAIYARRARLPLAAAPCDGRHSWDMLGTNLSVKNADGSWGTETERLLLMDSRDFNRIGIGVDDLIEAYMQTVLSILAIDGLACKLLTPEGKFGMKLFRALNPDPKLLAELYPTQHRPQNTQALNIGPISNKVTTDDKVESNGRLSSRRSSLTEEILAEQLERKLELATHPNRTSPGLPVF
ncbi:hypothetical protein KP509_25G040100 [Ceratopteris richardii]|uniref:Uncharacterized protein n=1 Tax=Ceratopteris richardii TaxID=49495 RepID=A0A8T2RRG8_CERRI|nr:hypothetical protein KP509_25G040100 [Ceratopteris richardii]